MIDLFKVFHKKIKLNSVKNEKMGVRNNIELWSWDFEECFWIIFIDYKLVKCKSC